VLFSPQLIVPSRRAVSGGGGGSGDPNFSSVVLLAGFDGTNGSTSFSDESSKLHGAATFSGSSTLSTTQIKFGTASLKCIGAGAGMGGASWPANADFTFGSGAFTVECFYYANTIASANQPLLAVFDVNGGQGAWMLRINGHVLEWTISTNGSTGTDDMFPAGMTAITAGAYHHAAVDFDGSKYRMYSDGVCVATFSTPRTMFTATTSKLTVGSTNDNAFWSLDGYVDEARITKGIARYASDTTYTVPTAAFPRS